MNKVWKAVQVIGLGAAAGAFQTLTDPGSVAAFVPVQWAPVVLLAAGLLNALLPPLFKKTTAAALPAPAAGSPPAP